MSENGNFAELATRLRERAAAADVNQQNITAALHREAAEAIDALCAKVSGDRVERWELRRRLDSALGGSA